MNLMNKKKLSLSNEKNILPIKNIIRRKSKFDSLIDLFIIEEIIVLLFSFLNVKLE